MRRRPSLIALALIIVFTTMAQACVIGWTGQSSSTCLTHKSCARTSRAHLGAPSARFECKTSLRSIPDKCGLRGFVHSQLARIDFASPAVPRLAPIGWISAPARTAVALSSIGSPPTDRGPPCA